MKTIIELMQAFAQFSADSIDMAAKAAVQSGLTGAKEGYMAWGKSIGVAAKALEEAWKSAQPEKAKGGPRGFADMYYDWLAGSAREEQEAHDYIMSNESPNVRNHLTHYLNIWALAESVRQGRKVSRTISAGKAAPKASTKKQSAEPKGEWEYNEATPHADVRSAWETLRREMAKPKSSQRKTKVHPDKVAQFNDEELTTAYNKAFQSMNKVR